MNSAYLALDRQIEEGRGEQTALIYDSPVTGTQDRYSYLRLRDEVARLAGALRALGVGKGDRVIIYMPMVPQAAMAMLACARLGAVHSVVFGGFAPYELALRIDDATPKLVLTASCGLEFDRVIEYKPLVDKALELAIHQPAHVMVWQRPQAPARLHPGRDLDWQDCLAAAEPADPLPVASGDPLYIMYTSGTTGKPKGIVRDNGGHAVAVRYAVRTIYGMQAGDVWWGISDVGWVVGHSLIVYGPLMCGCTTVFYEGKPVRTPDAGAYWRVIEEHRVNSLFCAPTAIRAIRKEDPHGERVKRYDLGSLRHLFLAGEKLDSSTQHWLEEHTGRPVHDHWWQTETGWPVTAPCIGIAGHDLRAGSTNRAVPGYHVQVLDDEGRPLGANRQGAIVIALPLAPDNRRVLCAAPGYLAERGEPRQPDDLREHNCLLYQLGGRVHDRWAFQRGRRSLTLTVAGDRVCDDADVVRRWALAGKGLVYKSWLDVAEDVRAGRLRLLLPEWQGEATPMNLLCTHRAQLTRPVTLLRAFVRERCDALLAEAPWTRN
ncbi:TPA: AMP-binding protein [Pseudomonas aeruginosa]